MVCLPKKWHLAGWQVFLTKERVKLASEGPVQCVWKCLCDTGDEPSFPLDTLEPSWCSDMPPAAHVLQPRGALEGKLCIPEPPCVL